MKNIYVTAMITQCSVSETMVMNSNSTSTIRGYEVVASTEHPKFKDDFGDWNNPTEIRFITNEPVEVGLLVSIQVSVDLTYS